MTTSVRNRPLFTCVHSHAAGQKLSGRIFAVPGRERAGFWPGGRRNALRASQAVRPSTVMLKQSVRQNHMRISRMLLEKLRLLECSLHGDRRNDREWLERLLHPEFREITRSGVMVDRSETITSLLSENTALPIISSDFRLTEMAGGCALLHYRTTYADGSRPALRSSCWLCSENGQWTLIFHQGTPAACGA